MPALPWLQQIQFHFWHNRIHILLPVLTFFNSGLADHQIPLNPGNTSLKGSNILHWGPFWYQRNDITASACTAPLKGHLSGLPFFGIACDIPITPLGDFIDFQIKGSSPVHDIRSTPIYLIYIFILHRFMTNSPRKGLGCP